MPDQMHHLRHATAFPRTLTPIEGCSHATDAPMDEQYIAVDHLPGLRAARCTYTRAASTGWQTSLADANDSPFNVCTHRRQRRHRKNFVLIFRLWRPSVNAMVDSINMKDFVRVKRGMAN